MTALFIFITLGLPLLIFMAPPFRRPLQWAGLRFWLSVIVVWCGLYCLQKYVISPNDVIGQEMLRRLGKQGVDLAAPVILGWIPGLFGAGLGLCFGYWLRKPHVSSDPRPPE